MSSHNFMERTKTTSCVGNGKNIKETARSSNGISEVKQYCRLTPHSGGEKSGLGEENIPYRRPGLLWNTFGPVSHKRAICFYMIRLPRISTVRIHYEKCGDVRTEWGMLGGISEHKKGRHFSRKICKYTE